MKKFILGLLGAVGLISQSSTGAQTSPSEMSKELRTMVLNLRASDIGINKDDYPLKVWGVVMETGVDEGYYTLVSLADGSTSLYFSNGGGIIGAGEHVEVKKVSHQFLAVANQSVEHAVSTESFPTPENGQTIFYFLTFDGVKTYSAPEQMLGEEKDKLSNLFHAAHAVIAEVRQVK